MGSFSIWHWLIVLLVVMLVFGTKKLRNIGGDLGGAVKGFKEAMNEGKKAVDAEVTDQEAANDNQEDKNLVEGNAVDAPNLDVTPKKKAPVTKKAPAVKVAVTKSTPTKTEAKKSTAMKLADTIPAVKKASAKPKAATTKKSNP